MTTRNNDDDKQRRRRTMMMKNNDGDEQRQRQTTATTNNINEKLEVACTQFNVWNAAGSRVDAESGYPIMTSKCALSIVKVLLPKIDPTAKLSDYTTMKVCTKWLGESLLVVRLGRWR